MSLDFYASDPRVRKYCVPVRIVKTFGNVEREEALLVKRPPQIPLATPDEWQPCVLKGKGAAVLVDFGKEFHGSARIYVQNVIKTPAPRVRVRIRMGESVSEALTPWGGKGSTNDHANRDYEWNLGFLSANETPETGYRFLYIELLEDAELQLYMLEGVAIFRDMKRLGSFKCSDPRINEIFETAVYTAHQCCQEYIWDGIKRDRLIWCGDMFPSVLTLLSVYGDKPFIRESLDMQKTITPIGKWMNGIPLYSMWWILCHDLIYMHSGDKQYLEAQIDYIAELTKFAAGFIGEDGAEKLPFAFLDWPNSENPVGVHAGQQAVMNYAFERAAYLLDECGKTEDAEFCRAQAELLKQPVVDPNGSKQAAALMGLGGIADMREMNAKVIAPGGAHGYSTFLGWATLAAKAEADDMNGALDDMKAYWGKMLDLGATTFWEDFSLDWTQDAYGITEIVPEGANDIHADHGAYCYKGLRHSLCHAWASGPAPFLIKYVLGIKPVTKGCSECEISPDLGDLDWAEGSYPTPYGLITVRHEKSAEGDIITRVSAPKEITLLS